MIELEAIPWEPEAWEAEMRRGGGGRARSAPPRPGGAPLRRSRARRSGLASARAARPGGRAGGPNRAADGKPRPKRGRRWPYRPWILGPWSAAPPWDAQPSMTPPPDGAAEPAAPAPDEGGEEPPVPDGGDGAAPEGEPASEFEPLSEAELDELALELLDVTSGAELDRFLGAVFKKVGSFAKKGIKVLGKGLKAVAPIALPLLAKVAGSAFGGPIGGMIGGKLGSLAANAIAGELVGETYEDREFELARRYVRLASLSAQRFAPAAGESTESAAVRAMGDAARRLTGAPVAASLRSRTEGRWTKRGRRLIVYL